MTKKQTDKNTADIRKLLASHQEHLKIANQEMGDVKSDILLMKADIATIKTHVEWVKRVYENWEEKWEKLDDRVFYILTSVIVGFLGSLAMFGLSLYFQ